MINGFPAEQLKIPQSTSCGCLLRDDDGYGSKGLKRSGNIIPKEASDEGGC
ncbi:MAG TPA: hypothetical protein VK213_05840 [Bacteroidales bacterium]|nr:hypothetical protein [Bacteroidales bacterium]